MTVMAQATPAGAKVRSQEAVECGGRRRACFGAHDRGMPYV